MSLPDVVTIMDPNREIYEQDVVYNWMPEYCDVCMKIGYKCAPPEKESPPPRPAQPRRRRRPQRAQPQAQAWVAKPAENNVGAREVGAGVGVKIGAPLIEPQQTALVGKVGEALVQKQPLPKSQVVLGAHEQEVAKLKGKIVPGSNAMEGTSTIIEGVNGSPQDRDRVIASLLPLDQGGGFSLFQ
ncbi:hypothetical protein K7X08_006249 [Anisodus acutangulus]|uniref:Uncharacterized protein n=1 Tax=Anisodus acutangulus TaxID=402998 RepID=A0A9Q1MYS2_9SOLA|nr:hypothetical protein K7X08_006249 [Anisodus acutangulus]